MGISAAKAPTANAGSMTLANKAERIFMITPPSLVIMFFVPAALSQRMAWTVAGAVGRVCAFQVTIHNIFVTFVIRNVGNTWAWCQIPVVWDWAWIAQSRVAPPLPERLRNGDGLDLAI